METGFVLNIGALKTSLYRNKSLVKWYKNLNPLMYCKMLYRKKRKVFLFLFFQCLRYIQNEREPQAVGVCLICCDPLEMCWVCSAVPVPAADANSAV